MSTLRARRANPILGSDGSRVVMTVDLMVTPPHSPRMLDRSDNGTTSASPRYAVPRSSAEQAARHREDFRGVTRSGRGERLAGQQMITTGAPGLELSWLDVTRDASR